MEEHEEMILSTNREKILAVVKKNKNFLLDNYRFKIYIVYVTQDIMEVIWRH
jgi:hypothetical protein